MFFKNKLKATICALGMITMTTVYAEAIKLSEAPQHLTLYYVLHWKGLTGKASYSVDQSNAHQYTIRSIAQGNGVASILGKAIMISEGEIDDSTHQLRPHYFKLDKPIGKDEQAVFDWNERIITLKDGRKVPFKDKNVYDPLSLAFQFYWNPPKQQLKNLIVATTKKVGTYVFRNEGKELLTINHTKVETEIWRRYNANGNLEMTIWLAPGHHYIPVKMHDYNGNDDIRELVLSSMAEL